MTERIRHFIPLLLVVPLIGCRALAPAPTDEPEPPERPPIEEPEPPDPEPPTEPEPPIEPESPERPAQVPQPIGPPAEHAGFTAWAGHLEEPRWKHLTHPPAGTPGPPGDDPPDEDPPEDEPPDPPEEEPPGGGPVDEVGAKVVLGLRAVQHHPLTLAFVWGEPIAGNVSQYSGHFTDEATGKKRGFSQTPNPSPGGESESRRYDNLAPLGWYAFEVKAHFADGTVGTLSSVRGQAPDVVPPLYPSLSTCAAVEAALADGDRVLYSGQCHSGSWSYFTNDARSKGGADLLINAVDAGTFVCGHSNERELADGLWCSSNAEWALVGEKP